MDQDYFLLPNDHTIQKKLLLKILCKLKNIIIDFFPFLNTIHTHFFYNICIKIIEIDGDRP